MRPPPYVPWLVGLLAALAALRGALGPERLRIERPRLGIPAMLQAQATFTIECSTARATDLSAARVFLESALGRVPLDASVRRHSAARFTFEARLPDSIPVGAYTLTLRLGDLEARRTRAVHVIDAIPESVCVVQLADLPTFALEPVGSPDRDGPGDRSMRSIVDEINLIGPDFVLCSGDIAYGGADVQFERLFQALERLDAPVIVAAGNHEYDGWSAYLDTFGTPWHAVDWGPFRILSLNSGHGRDQFTRAQFDWLESELASAAPSTPLVQLHHPVFGGRNLEGLRDRFVDLVEAHSVELVLSGHLHGDRVFDRSGALREDTYEFEGPSFAVTTAAGATLRPEVSSVPPHHGYRVVRFDGTRLQTYTYDYDGDGERDAASSHPIGQLRVEPVDAFTVRVHNDWHEPVPAARVPFPLSAGAALGRQAEPGRLLAPIERDGVAQVLVEVDLPARSQTLVRLKPSNP